MTPPAVEQAQQKPRPREVVFVIDNSGSMGGTSIVQAKASLIYALGRLKPADRFNVIRFDNTMDVLFPDTVPADAEQCRARQGLRRRAAGARRHRDGAADAGGADRSTRQRRRAIVRQVVFLTDGEIGNEQQLFDTIGAMRGRSRVFMVGIGSAPNTFLMTRAAELGRGTFTHIGSVEQVEERMRALFEKLESPAVTNLTATFSAARADVTPAVLPDLYRGEPLVLAAKVGALAGTLEIKGRSATGPGSSRCRSRTRPKARACPSCGRGARSPMPKSRARCGRSRPRRPTSASSRSALEHQLVTRLTSLVAVDKTPSRPEGARLTRADLPLNLPAGWDFDKVFGGERPSSPRKAHERDASSSQIQLAANASVAIKRAPKPIVVSPQAGMQLPKTATDAELRMMFGLALLLLSLVLLVLTRRRRFA